MFKLRFLRYALKGSVIYAFKRVFSPFKRVSTQRFFDPGIRQETFDSMKIKGYIKTLKFLKLSLLISSFFYPIFQYYFNFHNQFNYILKYLLLQFFRMKFFLYFIGLFQMGLLNGFASGLPIKNTDAVFFENVNFQGMCSLNKIYI